MSATNAIVLSSPMSISNHGTPPDQQDAMPSSPMFPSPSQLLSRKPSIPTGSNSNSNRRSPIPKDACAGFTKASSLLRHTQSVDISSLDPIETENISTDPSAQRKGKVSVNETGHESTVPKANPRKEGRNKTKTIETIKPREPKETTQRRSKLDKSVDDIPQCAKDRAAQEVRDDRHKLNKKKSSTQSTIKKAKITKIGSVNLHGPGCKDSGNGKEAPGVCQGVVEASETDNNVTFKVGGKALALNLNGAIQLRQDWTPVKNTNSSSVNIQDTKDAPTGTTTSKHTEKSTHFGNLFDDYGFAQMTTSKAETIEVTRNSSGEALTKRRKLEVLNAMPQHIHSL